jgi:hypothetical protein
MGILMTPLEMGRFSANEFCSNSTNAAIRIETNWIRARGLIPERIIGK